MASAVLQLGSRLKSVVKRRQAKKLDAQQDAIEDRVMHIEEPQQHQEMDRPNSHDAFHDLHADPLFGHHHHHHAKGSEESWSSQGTNQSEFPDHMWVDRMKLLDVNGLVGKSYRNPVTGAFFLKEVESWRDFGLVDIFTRKTIHGYPDELAADEHLFIPRPLPMRTWVYHCKFRRAFEQFQIGLNTETFLHEALNSRCIDLDIRTGQWSPLMVYAPLVPVTLLADDSTVFVLASAVAFVTLLVSIAMNSHKFYYWTRPALLPFRLLFMVLAAIRIKGEAMQIAGYVIIVLAALADICFGDLVLVNSMRSHCHYNILRTLPKQVYVCTRVGDNRMQAGEHHFRRLSEKVVGCKDPGDNSLCLIANIQGLLVELVPVDIEDLELFTNEHQARMHSANLKFFGIDLFHPEIRTVQEFDSQREKHDPMTAVLALTRGNNTGPRFGKAKANDDIQVVDIA